MKEILQPMNELNFVQWMHETEVLGISLSDYAVGLLAAVVAYLAMTTALSFAQSRVQALAGRTKTRVDDILATALAGTSRWLILLAAILIGVGLMDLPARWGTRISQLWFVTLAIQIGLWTNRAMRAGLRVYEEKHTAGGTNPQASAAATLLAWAFTTLVWAVVLLSILANLGVNITAFVASLGVGGIAVALAVQNILGDLFASVSIAADKPFEVGDFIAVNGTSGTVERIGLKTTRIRSLGGEQIVMGNTELLKQTINNYKRLQERRVVFGFGLTYSTTPEQAAQVPDIVKRAVQASEKLRFDRAHFKGFGESSLDYEVVYIVLDPAFNLYMDEQQRINLTLMREFEAIGVEFAFPTRTVVVPKDSPLVDLASSTLQPAAPDAAARAAPGAS